MLLWVLEPLWSFSTERKYISMPSSDASNLSFSINRDRGYSIMEQLEKAGINPKDYIRFYNLRSYDRINTPAVEKPAG